MRKRRVEREGGDEKTHSCLEDSISLSLSQAQQDSLLKQHQTEKRDLEDAVEHLRQALQEVITKCMHLLLLKSGHITHQDTLK